MQPASPLPYNRLQLCQHIALHACRYLLPGFVAAAAVVWHLTAAGQSRLGSYGDPAHGGQTVDKTHSAYL